MNLAGTMNCAPFLTMPSAKIKILINSTHYTVPVKRVWPLAFLPPLSYGKTLFWNQSKGIFLN
jgi:hypothetical protein